MTGIIEHSLIVEAVLDSLSYELSPYEKKGAWSPQEKVVSRKGYGGFYGETSKGTRMAFRQKLDAKLTIQSKVLHSDETSIMIDMHAP